MSVSAAELPAMSSALGTSDEIAAQLRRRLDGGLRRIAFFIVPSAMAIAGVGGCNDGGSLSNGPFQSRGFEICLGHPGRLYDWAAGLDPGRLYASTYYALHDTRTPLLFAVVRVTLTTLLGYLFAFLCRQRLVSIQNGELPV